MTYSIALPQTDLVYRAALGGYKDDVVLKTPEASGTLSYLVEAPGLSLRTTPTGDVAGDPVRSVNVSPRLLDATVQGESSHRRAGAPR